MALIAGLRIKETHDPVISTGAYLQSGVFGELLTEIAQPGARLNIPIDVLHDLLGELSKSMLCLTNQRKAEMKRFLPWIEKELRILSDRKGRNGIETLTGKTILKDYMGDCQKNREQFSFDVLWSIVLKNKSRLNRSLDSKIEQELRNEYQRSISKLLPIKQKLGATSWLIDQLVYRLYGLNYDEISVLEEGNLKK